MSHPAPSRSSEGPWQGLLRNWLETGSGKNQLCDLEQLPSPFWASVFPSGLAWLSAISPVLTLCPSPSSKQPPSCGAAGMPTSWAGHGWRWMGWDSHERNQEQVPEVKVRSRNEASFRLPRITSCPLGTVSCGRQKGHQAPSRPVVFKLLLPT